MGLLGTIAMIGVCAGIDRVRRAWRWVRCWASDALIDVAMWAAPPLPPHVDPDYERMRRRTMAAVARERQVERRNGHG